MIVALDGPSGSGKSSTAKAVAAEMNLLYLNTGAMYRGLTWLALQRSVEIDQRDELVDLAQKTIFDFDSQGNLMVDGRVLIDELVGPEVTKWVSHYCQIPLVREALTNQQRRLGNSRDSILDGRDIGTVVFPDADLKFFLVADYRVRAERRHLELLEKGIEQSIDEIEANLRERDRLDTERETAPLIKAADARTIDTTQMSFAEQVNLICSAVRVVAAEQNESTQTPNKQL